MTALRYQPRDLDILGMLCAVGAQDAASRSNQADASSKAVGGIGFSRRAPFPDGIENVVRRGMLQVDGWMATSPVHPQAAPLLRCAHNDRRVWTRHVSLFAEIGIRGRRGMSHPHRRLPASARVSPRGSRRTRRTRRTGREASHRSSDSCAQSPADRSRQCSVQVVAAPDAREIVMLPGRRSSRKRSTPISWHKAS